MNTSQTPLVSVPIITYNSAKTIVETLDSVYNQTYKNLELIISDDCSTDNTVDICIRWLSEHENRFVRTKLITTKHNSGLSANQNNALTECRGEWIKDFDGDDIMLPHCISTYIAYVLDHPEVEYVFSKIKCFDGTPDRRAKMEEFFIYDFFSWSPKEQYDFFTTQRNCIPSLGSFYNKDAIVRKHGITYDERIPLIDDWPRWINLLTHGVKLHFIDEVLTLYRMSENALSSQTTQTTAYDKSYALVYQYYGFKNDCKKNGKRYAINRYLRNEKLLHDNNIFWSLVCKLYKILVLHRL